MLQIILSLLLWTDGRGEGHLEVVGIHLLSRIQQTCKPGKAKLDFFFQDLCDKCLFSHFYVSSIVLTNMKYFIYCKTQSQKVLVCVLLFRVNVVFLSKTQCILNIPSTYCVFFAARNIFFSVFCLVQSKTNLVVYVYKEISFNNLFEYKFICPFRYERQKVERSFHLYRKMYKIF